MSSKEDSIKVYDEFFEHATHLLNDHQLPVELVAGTMMAIGQRLYRTHLNKLEFKMLMDSIRDTEIEPYNVEKIRLH
jgi:hypothetical protein